MSNGDILMSSLSGIQLRCAISGIGLSPSQVNQPFSGFMEDLRRANASLEDVSLKELEEATPTDHFFRKAFVAAKEAGFIHSEEPVAYRVALPGPAACRKDLGTVATHHEFIRMHGYIPPRWKSGSQLLLIHDALTLGAVLLRHDDDPFQLNAVHREPSLDGLAGMVEGNTWPYYVGPPIKVHELHLSSYAAGLHDRIHYLNWIPWSSDHRQDSVLLYRVLKAYLDPTQEKRNHDILDRCLTGPGLSAALLHKLQGFDMAIWEDYFYASAAQMFEEADERPEELRRRLEEALQDHPRRDRWLSALKTAKATPA